MNGLGGAFLAGSIVGKMVLDRTKWAQSISKVKDDEQSLKGFSQRTTQHLQGIGRGLTLLGGTILGTFGVMIKQASDAEETYAKFGTVFKDVSGAAEESARNLAEGYGISTMAAKDMLGATGDLLTGLGVMPGVALDLSEKTQQLAVDLASFTNYSGGAKGASDALTKAMLGERESVKALGIVITEEMVKEQLLAMGKADLTGLALKQASAEATLRIAYSQSKNAIGDYERTSNSFANQSRLLKARLSDVAVTIGTQLIPVATQIVQKITGVVMKIKEWTDAHPELTNRIVKIVAIVGSVMLVLGPLLIILPKLVAGFGAVGTTVKAVGVALTAFKGVSMAALGPIGLLTAALGALAIGYMKVKAARDAADESARRAAEAEDNLFAKMKKAADQAGLTEVEFLRLRDAYDGNAAAMAMAIKRGEEGVELQQALATVGKEHAEAVEEQKKKMEEAAGAATTFGAAMGGAHTANKLWLDFLREQGIFTVDEKIKKTDELYITIEQLNEAYKQGKIDQYEWADAVKAARDQIDEVNIVRRESIPLERESLATTLQFAPAIQDQVFAYQTAEEQLADFAMAHHMTSEEVQLQYYNMVASAMQFAGVAMPEVTRSVSKDAWPQIKTAADNTSNAWTEASERIRDKWTWGLKDMLMGAQSFKDVLGGVWGTIKEQFFTMIAQLISKWTMGFVASVLGGAGDVASSLTGGIGNAAKGLGSIFGSATGQAGGLLSSIGGIASSLSPGGMLGSAIGSFLGGLIGGPKGAGFDKHDSGNLAELRDITRNARDLLRIDFTNFAHIIKDHLSEIRHHTFEIQGRSDVANKLLKELINIAGECATMLSKVTSAQQGAIIERAQLVMAHGTPMNPEIIMPSDKLRAFAARARAEGTTVNIASSVALQGTMISDRDYARHRLMPEILDALATGAYKERLKKELGI